MPESHSDLQNSGVIPHALLDNLYQQVTLGHLRLIVSTADVSNPPTDAELDTEFGTPADVGPGFLRLIDDNAAGAHFYLVASDGTNWWTFTATKAV
jgi:hypothetical protein